MGRVRTVRRRAAYLLGILQLSFSIGLAANLVFCQDAYGQLSVEPAGVCCTESLGLGGPTLGENCGCTDTPVFRGLPEGLSPSRLEASLPTLYALISSPQAVSLPPLSPCRVLERIACASRSAALHRTVVLLL